jgi:hypothetical protein
MNKIIKTKEFFGAELERILNIHFDAKYYFKDVQYLNNPETTEERKAAAENFIIRRIRVAFWRIGIIEMAKLFQKSRNQHYNLIDYIGDLNQNYIQYPWLLDLPQAKLNEWLTSLSSERIKSIRDRICIQRDNYFAHTDKNPSSELSENQISFEEINSLIDLTESIMFDIKYYCFDTHSDFEVTGLERAGDILLAFASLDEKRERINKQEWDEWLKERDKMDNKKES